MISALRVVNRPVPIVIHTDSSYVKDGITKWIHAWKRNRWLTAAKKPVKNVELWQALDDLVSRHEITWVWVKGHDGDPGNEKADELANRGVEVARGKLEAPRPGALLNHSTYRKHGIFPNPSCQNAAGP